jgi:hypothetical protein
MSIDAMQQALEALEYHQEQTRPIHKTQKTIIALRQAIEEAEQWDTSDMAHRSGWLSVEQEPVAQCTNSDTWNCKYCRKTKTCEALKDSRNFGEPPKREWVGLTDEEIVEILDIDNPTIRKFAYAIEAKLKEKNNG